MCHIRRTTQYKAIEKRRKNTLAFARRKGCGCSSTCAVAYTLSMCLYKSFVVQHLVHCAVRLLSEWQDNCPRNPIANRQDCKRLCQTACICFVSNCFQCSLSFLFLFGIFHLFSMISDLLVFVLDFPAFFNVLLFACFRFQFSSFFQCFLICLFSFSIFQLFSMFSDLLVFVFNFHLFSMYSD